MSQDDHLTLASNVKSFSDTNIISKFKTKLSRRREYPPNEDWRVALTEISYKQNWYNLKETSRVTLYTFNNERVTFGDFNVEIEAGFYETVLVLINYINEELTKLNHQKYDHEKYLIDSCPCLSYNKFSHFVTVEAGSFYEKSDPKQTPIPVIPTFSEELEKMLGLVDENGLTLHDRIMLINIRVYTRTDDYIEGENRKRKMYQMITEKKIHGSRPADINCGINNFFIYTNIVQQSDVGNTFAPIITTIPIKRSNDGWGGSVVHEPKNLIYRRLQTRIFDTIEIDIRDDSGQQVQFESGSVVIKLHFLKYG